MYFQLILYILGLVLLFAFITTFAYSVIRAIGWVPLWKKDLQAIIKLADIKEGEKLCDLGCGDGRLLAAASQAGAKATGYELSFFFYLVSKLRSAFSKHKFEVKFRDFWLVDLSDMDIVFFFLIPKIYPKMRDKLAKELKPGARVIAYVWPIDGWQAYQVFKRDKGPAIYIYKIS